MEGIYTKELHVFFSGLPDTAWLKEMIPEIDIDKFRHGLIGQFLSQVVL